MDRSQMRIKVVDSHTGGEPTRVVCDGVPDLGHGSMAERMEILRAEHDWLRTALVNEPRGSDVMVGAVVQPPLDSRATAGVIFFNNVGYLGMCGHGMIGVVSTLSYLGRLSRGRHAIETPVGIVQATLHEDERVSVENVPSYRIAKNVSLKLSDSETVVGDIAWGGNWFFLVSDHGQAIEHSNADRLTQFCWKIRLALREQNRTGQNGQEIDHIELFGPPSDLSIANSRSFVLCPGKAYDRSPCGTGTSAKIACLAADGQLEPGATWRQQSIVGGVFDAHYRRDGETILPTITGRAFVNAETIVVFHPDDPFAAGIS